jgi:hypothetical protein
MIGFDEESIAVFVHVDLSSITDSGYISPSLLYEVRAKRDEIAIGMGNGYSLQSGGFSQLRSDLTDHTGFRLMSRVKL